MASPPFAPSCYEPPTMTPPPKSPIERLRTRIQESVTIPDREWDYAKQHFHTEIYPKNSYLVKAGEKSNRVYSITRGLVRYFYITESGKEFNKYFVTDNRFFGSFSSLFLDMPCGFFIQALEETEVLAITKSSMEEMYSRHICWERGGRLSAMSFAGEIHAPPLIRLLAPATLPG